MEPRVKGILRLLGLACMLGLAVWLSVPAQAEPYQSRLGQLLKNRASLYLPSRLVLGQENRFTVKAPPGSQVRVFLSSEKEGMVFADRLPLRVGTDVEELSGQVPESGVLELALPLPNEPEWSGQVLYVDAVVGRAADLSDYARPEMVDATGRRTTGNALVIAKPAEKNNLMVMPSVPGLDPQIFNQFTTLTDVYTSEDGRKKDLLYDGDINRDTTVDRSRMMQDAGGF